MNTSILSDGIEGWHIITRSYVYYDLGVESLPCTVESSRFESGSSAISLRRWLRDSEVPRAVLLLVSPVLLTRVHLQWCYKVSISATMVLAKHESSVTWWVVHSILC